MDNVVLVDFDVNDNWEFLSALESTSNQKWTVIKGVSNKNHGSKLQTLIRYFKYFYLPFQVCLKKNRIKNVLAWQQFYGLILAFYLKAFHAKKVPNIVIMTFIYKHKKGFIGKAYYWFIKYIVTSKAISAIIVFSKSEAQYYSKIFGVNEELFVVEQLGIEDEANSFFQRTGVSERYYLTAGRSNRDYAFIQNNWDSDYPIYVISDECNDEDQKNIIHLKNCFGNDYLEKLRNSYAVIIPLENTRISSGQLVILQAFMLGKPVIITENDTVTDYVTDGYNGFVIKKEKEALRIALVKIDSMYQDLSQNARSTFIEKYSLASMGGRIGSLFKNSVCS